MRIRFLSIIACKAILFCSGQSSAASSNDTDDTIEERLTQWSELSLESIFSDSTPPEIQLTSTWPVGGRTFMTLDAGLQMKRGYSISADSVSLGLFHRWSPALLFGATVFATKSDEGRQGTFTASTSWSGSAGDTLLSTSASASYSNATAWEYEALASGDFPIDENITGYAEVWLLGTEKLGWGAAFGVALSTANGSEVKLQVHRDFGELPAHGFLAEYYRSLGNNGSLTVSGKWDKDLITSSRDLTLSFDTDFSISSAVSLGLSGSSSFADSHNLSSEAQLDVTFEREDGSIGLSASRSFGEYQNATFSIEWVSRW